MPTRKTSVNLYWVATEDHGEDWFIFARTRRSAARFHEQYEGFNPNDANSRLVLPHVGLTKFANGKPPCHAQIEDLVALGFEPAGQVPHQRAVRLGDELFAEGGLEALIAVLRDNVHESRKQGRPNNTKRPSE